MDQEFHMYNEGRDDAAYEQMTSRNPGNNEQDARNIHNFAEDNENMKESIDTSSRLQALEKKDANQEQFIRARHLRQMR